MGNTPVFRITPAGGAKPTLAEALAFVQAAYRSIYGQDVYLGNDSQDGQFLALLAQALDDVNGEGLATFNSFSPATAQGTGLDRNVKLNGIRRKRATYSTVPLLLVGVAGTVINDGAISDPDGNRWAFPATVTMPGEGQILVQGTCQTIGAIPLAAGAIDTANGSGSIFTVQNGLQSVTNPVAATPGLPVETDAALRIRQALSTMLPSLRILDGLKGALSAVEGVSRLEVFQNTKGYRDADGIPGHCVAAVLDGGDPVEIGQILELKKGIGVSTYGTSSVIVTPNSGVPETVAFSYLAKVPLAYAVTIRRISGYTQSVEDQWKASLAGFVNGLGIGEDVRRDQAFAAAKLYDGAGSKTFSIVSFYQSRDGAPPSAIDVPIAFYEAATLDPANVAVTVLPS